MKKLTSHIPLARSKVQSLATFAKAHKIITGLVLLTLVIGVYSTVKAAKGNVGTRYILGSAERGTLETTVSGTGTVSAKNQLDLKAKASGDIISLSVHTGQSVSAGAVIASIDPQDALTALKGAQLIYEKLTQPADASNVIAAKQSLTDAQTAQVNAYTNTLKDITSTFLDLPSTIDGMNTLLYTNTGYLNDSSVSALGTTAQNYRTVAGQEFDKARRNYDSLKIQFAALSATSNNASKVEILGKTQSLLTDILTALKDAQTAVTYVKSLQSVSSDAGSRQAVAVGTSAQSDLAGWINTISSNYTSLTSDQSAIQSTPNIVAQRQASLDKLLEGPDSVDLRSEQLSLSTKQDAYNDTFVRAPFNGKIGRLSVDKGDSVSNGTIVATLITDEKIATISLNEVDAAKVKPGNKVALTFDAVSGLSLTGTVSDIDLIGTETQGVVNYTAKIALDEDDARVLSGMSANATITTDAKAGTLIVPASAVKTDKQGSYVLVFDPALPKGRGAQGVVSKVPPKRVAVETGISNDTDVEIISGLNEGEEVVIRTAAVTAGAATVAAAPAPSLFGGGSQRASTGNVRFGGAR